jgi:hypothetical protein
MELFFGCLSLPFENVGVFAFVDDLFFCCLVLFLVMWINLRGLLMELLVGDEGEEEEEEERAGERGVGGVFFISVYEEIQAELEMQFQFCNCRLWIFMEVVPLCVYIVEKECGINQLHIYPVACAPGKKKKRGEKKSI